MGRNIEEVKDVVEVEVELGGSAMASPGRSPSKPNSMIIKGGHAVFPAHLVAEAISTLRGLNLRWSGPITPSEMLYVQEYVYAKYPEYCNGLVEQGDKIDLYTLCVNEESSDSTPDQDKGKSPRAKDSYSPSSNNSSTDLDGTQLDPSKLLDVLTKKSTFQGNFISIPEIQARNKALQNCGLTEAEYLVVFTPTIREAMMMVGESYPFSRGNYYMTVLGEEQDFIKEFAVYKDSKVVVTPESWLDLRIKGSQLSQYFRRKCKTCPKGLFAYPADVSGTRYSMHWISEAHRNSWHVLLDATGLDVGKHRLTLAIHRPDFVMCSLDNINGQTPSKITCLLLRRNSFATTPTTSSSISTYTG